MKRIFPPLAAFHLLTLLITACLPLTARAQTPDWHRARQGRGADVGQGTDIGTDPDGNVFVAGYFEGSVAFGTTTLTSPGDTDVFLTKYDSTGKALWAKRAGGFRAAKATALSVDKQGNVYVTGTFRGIAQFDETTLQNLSTFNNDLFIAKYSNAGTLLWIRQVGNLSYNEEATGLSADANGGVYLTGGFQGDWYGPQLPINFGSVTAAIPGPRGLFLAKYDSEGTTLWVQGNTSATTYGSQINGVASDAAGNAYITGFHETQLHMDGLSFGSPIGSSARMFTFVGKFNPQGKIQWLTGTTVRGGWPNEAVGFDIAVDQQENAYVAGLLRGTAGFGNDLVLNSLADKDLFLAKYDRNGGLQWVSQAANACLAEYGIAGAYTASVCVDARQRPTVTGTFQRTAQFGNIRLQSTGGRTCTWRSTTRRATRCGPVPPAGQAPTREPALPSTARTGST